MRKSFRLVSLALPVALVALLSGCLPPDPIITPVPDPTSTPVFESEEEALAAAEAAYGEYLRVTDAIFSEGGKDIDRLTDVATGEQLVGDRDGFQQVVEEGLRSTGQTTFDQFSLQQYDANAREGVAIVSAYVCDDITGVDVVDSTGHSVVSSSRPNRTYFQVTFDLAPQIPRSLLVSSKEPWSDNGC
jgi:hypothetical protein